MMHLRAFSTGTIYRTRSTAIALLIPLALACSSSDADNPSGGGGEPSGGSGGATGGDGGAPPEGGSGGVAAQGGQGATSGAGGAGGSPATGGTGGGVPSGAYDAGLGVSADTPLDTLPGSSLVEACLRYNEYFNIQIPQEDQVRAACVTDAVLSQGAGTVQDCQSISQPCIDTIEGFPPSACVEPGADFDCPATVGQYEQCANELTAKKVEEVDLLRCESLDDPDILQKLDAATTPTATCIAFAEACPGFFPVPGIGPDAGAP